MGPEEDWRELETTSERRKIQNRLAQRAYSEFYYESSGRHAEALRTYINVTLALGRNLRNRTKEVEKLQKQLMVLQESQEPQADETPQSESASEQEPSGTMTPMTPITPDTAWSMDGMSQADDVFAQSQFPFPVMDDAASFFGEAAPSTQLMDAFASSRALTLASLTAESRAPPTMSSSFVDPSLSWMGDQHLEQMYNSPAPTATAPSTPRAKLDKPVTSELSLLHLAVSSGHLDTLQLLLRYGAASLEAKDAEGFTALQRAVMSGRTDLVSALLQHKPR